MENDNFSESSLEADEIMLENAERSNLQSEINNEEPAIGKMLQIYLYFHDLKSFNM